MSFPSGIVIKNLPAKAGQARDVGLIPGSGRSPGVGNGNPFQDSCLENSMDRRTQRATVHGVAKSWTQISDFHFLSCLGHGLFLFPELGDCFVPREQYESV